MDNFYDMTARAAQLYTLLSDELSRSVFRARLQYDVSPSLDALFNLCDLTGIPAPPQPARRQWRQDFRNILENGNQLFLYGAGVVGRMFAKNILAAHEDFSGFCDRNYQHFSDGVLGKPAVSPDYLLKNQNTCYIIITTNEFGAEVQKFLEENHFPKDHILSYFPVSAHTQQAAPVQYFEFPGYFPEGTAFVDAGCYDGADSLYFADWCGGKYSKIFAFEPDKKNYKICEHALASLPRIKLFEAGLGSKSASSLFFAVGRSHSRLAELKGKVEIADEIFQDKNITEIQIAALDALVGSETVGFIKMDIEGAELGALHGAKSVIVRDKPFLAVCVYHRPGDTLAIMDYLSGLVPEYRFWLRHYKFSSNETVLYAAAERDA